MTPTFQDSHILGKYTAVPDCRERMARTEELRCAYERIVQLEAILRECRDYIVAVGFDQKLLDSIDEALS
jgi:hypothetical protein